jgi:Beta-galactosidase
VDSFSRREFLSGSAVALLATTLRTPLWSQNLAANSAIAGGMPLLLGVDYYPDQTPESLWEEDGRNMEEAGITNVRIAEFAWALMEPSEAPIATSNQTIEDRSSDARSVALRGRRLGSSYFSGQSSELWCYHELTVVLSGSSSVVEH